MTTMPTRNAARDAARNVSRNAARDAARNTAIVTDSNSGIGQAEASLLGITVLDTPYVVNGTPQTGSDIAALSAQMVKGAAVSTSQIAPGILMDTWDRLLETHREIVYIPLSSGLSGSAATALMLAADDDYAGRVYVVDNHRVSVTQKESVYEACTLASAGNTAVEIKTILETAASDASIYIALPTLTYLRKGGRIGKTAAALGNILGIKPVLSIAGDKPELYAKARTMEKAADLMIAAAGRDIREHMNGREYQIAAAVSADAETAEKWKRKIMTAFGLRDLAVDILPPALTCHIGPGAFGIAVTAVSPEAAALSAKAAS